MSSFKPIYAIIVICTASAFCAIFEEHKKDGIPISQDDCVSGNIMAVHFIDGSGADSYAVREAITILNSYLTFCNGFRFIIAGVSDDYVPWPMNATTFNDTLIAQDWLESTLQPYRGIFDLQTSVNTFFALPQYSSYDPQINRPPFAVIYAYSDTVGGINNLLNGISQLQSKGYMVLLISNYLPRYKMSQLLQVLPQSNVISTLHGTSVSSTWLMSRYNASYTVPIVNQTGTSGYITSPNYPNNYENWDLREYYITAPSTSYTIMLTINDFELETYRDYLYVYKGSIMNDDDYLYHWTGNITVQNITIQSNAVTLRFFSDLSDVFRGFNISWTAISNTPEEKSDNFIG